MNTLVIYATKHGSAEKGAKLLSEKLSGKVDLCNLKAGRIPEIAQYDKVIIGGSIYAGRIQKEVSDFCSNNLNVLKGKKIGVFICCLNSDAAETQINSSFPKELLDVAAAKESFGGELSYEKLGFGEKLITKMVSKMASKSGDKSGAFDIKNNPSTISLNNIERFATLINNC